MVGDISMASPTGYIQNMSTALSAAKTGNEVGMKLLSKALDTQETMGASMIKMMENSVNPSVGGNFDMSV